MCFSSSTGPRAQQRYRLRSARCLHPAAVPVHSYTTYLVRTALGNQSEIGNVDRLGQTTLVGCVKDRIEGDVLEDLVDPQLVRVENHRSAS